LDGEHYKEDVISNVQLEFRYGLLTEDEWLHALQCLAMPKRIYGDMTCLLLA
jgi:hypothetical protein